MSDDIEPLRRVDGLDFVLNMKVPTPEENTLKMKNFGLLKDRDSLLIKISDESALDNAIAFLKSILVSKPTLIFQMPKNAGDALYTKLLNFGTSTKLKIRIDINL